MGESIETTPNAVFLVKIILDLDFCAPIYPSRSGNALSIRKAQVEFEYTRWFNTHKKSDPEINNAMKIDSLFSVVLDEIKF